MRANRRWRRPAWAVAAACLLLLGADLLHAQVFVRAGPEQGQGLLRARSDECFVVLPHHVVGQAGPTEAIRLVARGRVERSARFEAEYGSDVALLRVESDRPLACPPVWEDADALEDLLRNAREGVIESLTEHGGAERRFVRIIGYDAHSITVRAIDTGDGLFQGLSGSRLRVAGIPGGMLLEVDTRTGQGIVLRHDHMTDLLRGFFDRAAAAAPSRPVMDVADATPVLDRAVAAKNMSRQGQVEALEALLASGFDFGGADLSGIRLTGASLAGGGFAGASLAGTDLSRARAAQASFGRADLAFADLTGGDFTGATLTGARLGFADADSVRLRDADAARASFYGASLRGADLTNADLTGASFVMADLRGARLNGADLTDALFFMTHLEGASLQGATVKNTEVSGAILPGGTLTAAQARGTCTAWDDTDVAGPMFGIRVIERIPSDRYSGGMENRPLQPLGQYGTRQFSTGGLPRCAPRSDDNPGIYGSGERVDLDWGGLYPTALLSRAGRGQSWMRRVDVHMRSMMEALRAWHGLP